MRGGRQRDMYAVARLLTLGNKGSARSTAPSFLSQIDFVLEFLCSAMLTFISCWEQRWAPARRVPKASGLAACDALATQRLMFSNGPYFWSKGNEMGICSANQRRCPARYCVCILSKSSFKADIDWPSRSPTFTQSLSNSISCALTLLP
jgi:hypothetical protein